MNILHALGAPGFTLRQAAVAEDMVYWLFSDPRPRKWDKEMLRSTFHVSGAQQVAEAVAVLKAMCTLSDVVVDVMFQLQSTASIVLQPVHYAILHHSERLATLLLRAAQRVGTLDDTVQGATHGQVCTMVSPLMLAAVFADEQIVGMLRRHGAKMNSADVSVTLRLQNALLWADLEARLLDLGLVDEAEQLSREVSVLRQQVRESRSGYVPAAV